MVCNGIPNSGKVGRHLLFLENVKHQRVNGSIDFDVVKLTQIKKCQRKNRPTNKSPRLEFHIELFKK